MSEHEYADAPLWTVLDALGWMGKNEVPMSKVAKAIRTHTGYPGAYRAIGRAVAAGYVDVRPIGEYPATQGRAMVKLSDRGCRRWAAGSQYARDAVGAWRVAAARSTPGQPAMILPGKW